MNETHTAQPNGCHEVRPFLALAPLSTLEDEERAVLEAHLLECLECHDRSARIQSSHEALAEPDAEDFRSDAVWERIEAGIAADDFADEAAANAPATSAPTIAIGLACTFCHDALGRVDAHYCAACLAPHHIDCLREHGRCSALGCEETSTVRPKDLEGSAPPRRRARRRSPLLLGLLIGSPLLGLGTAAYLGFARYQSAVVEARTAALMEREAREAALQAERAAEALAAEQRALAERERQAAAALENDVIVVRTAALEARREAERRRSDILRLTEGFSIKVKEGLPARLQVIPERRRPFDDAWFSELAPKVRAFQGKIEALRLAESRQRPSGLSAESFESLTREHDELESKLRLHALNAGIAADLPVDLSFLDKGGPLRELMARASKVIGAAIVFETAAREAVAPAGDYASKPWREALVSCVEAAGLVAYETRSGNFILDLGNPKVREVIQGAMVHEALDRLRRYREPNMVVANSVRGRLSATFDDKPLGSVLASIAANHRLQLHRLNGAILVSGGSQNTRPSDVDYLTNPGWRSECFDPKTGEDNFASIVGLAIYQDRSRLSHRDDELDRVELPFEAGLRFSFSGEETLGAVCRALAAKRVPVLLAAAEQAKRAIGLRLESCRAEEVLTLVALHLGLEVAWGHDSELGRVSLKSERLLYTSEGEERSLAPAQALPEEVWGEMIALWQRPKTFLTTSWATAELVFAALDELSGQDILVKTQGSRLRLDLEGLPYPMLTDLAAFAMDAWTESRDGITSIRNAGEANRPEVGAAEPAVAETRAREQWRQWAWIQVAKDEGREIELFVQGVVGEADGDPERRLAIINDRIYRVGDLIESPYGEKSSTRLIEVRPDAVVLSPVKVLKNRGHWRTEAQEGPQVFKVRP